MYEARYWGIYQPTRASRVHHVICLGISNKSVAVPRPVWALQHIFVSRDKAVSCVLRPYYTVYSNRHMGVKISNMYYIFAGGVHGHSRCRTWHSHHTRAAETAQSRYTCDCHVTITPLSHDPPPTRRCRLTSPRSCSRIPGVHQPHPEHRDLRPAGGGTSGHAAEETADPPQCP